MSSKRDTWDALKKPVKTSYVVTIHKLPVGYFNNFAKQLSTACFNADVVMKFEFIGKITNDPRRGATNTVQLTFKAEHDRYDFKKHIQETVDDYNQYITDQNFNFLYDEIIVS